MGKKGESSILEEIRKVRFERIVAAKAVTRKTIKPPIKPLPPLTVEENRLLKVFHDNDPVIIGEISKARPDLGDISDKVEVTKLASAYTNAGVQALMVFVEPDFYMGNYSMIKKSRQVTDLPIIVKDFVVDPLQIVWANVQKAEAVVINASILSRDRVYKFAQIARSFKILPVIEVFTISDVEKLSGYHWEAVMVNNRDPYDFSHVIPDTSFALASTLPSEAVKISAEGVNSREYISLLHSVGYSAFVVGDDMLVDDNLEEKIKNLI